MQHRMGRRVALAGLAGLPLTGVAWAQGRPVRIVVPYSAGSGPDLFARRLAQGIAPRLGQAVIVDNRGGASTMLGAEHVAASPADGLTLMMTASTTFAANPHLYRRLSYDLAQFQPITMLARTRLALYASPTFATTDMAGAVALARAAPEPLHYGITGRGNSTHLTGEALKIAAGIELLDVPYRGTPAMQQGVMRGDIPLAIDGIPAWLSIARDGRVKVLAVTGEGRVGALPDVPSFAEAGLADTGQQHWYGLFAPAGLPAPVLERTHAAAVAAMADPELWQGLAHEGATIETNTPASFTAQIATEAEAWGRVIRRVGLVLE
ncbi:tripartite tricarboxylate transporter substrate binding protein [Roseomonas stagni]|uniref:Tripartite tricarboxylate transporter substrate binding protein n=1 Tax=Falsiroseomonas algicola TaxID=2716930 RepID=A0A6M1LHK5_9PROT|nr:tripartite tricarboxylate transporter substrate-binding protein [Falsiroseomonas algicola]NGM19731.1 tripartite tricarboxylate transporter substrate binding protein [Falsiroseomonas algicola]